LIHATDLFSTIAQAAGISEAKYFNSQSFYKTLSKSTTSARAYNYSEILDNDRPAKSGFTIRNERYKLITLDNNSFRFYDLKNDPYEKSNLINGNLSNEEQNILDKLIIEASDLRKK
jgi:arylsulfatase A-like enzyme